MSQDERQIRPDKAASVSFLSLHPSASYMVEHNKVVHSKYFELMHIVVPMQYFMQLYQHFKNKSRSFVLPNQQVARKIFSSRISRAYLTRFSKDVTSVIALSDYQRTEKDKDVLQ